MESRVSGTRGVDTYKGFGYLVAMQRPSSSMSRMLGLCKAARCTSKYMQHEPPGSCHSLHSGLDAPPEASQAVVPGVAKRGTTCFNT